MKAGDKVKVKDSGLVFTIEKVVGRRIFSKEYLMHTDIDCVELIES